MIRAAARGRARAPSPPFLAALLFLSAPPDPAAAQADVSGYALGVGTRQASSDVGPAGTTTTGRVRLMVDLTHGWGTYEVAYEHLATRTPAGGAFTITAPGGSAAAGGDWIGADWSIHSTPRTSWRHRLDRAAARLTRASWELTVGRQAVSWANTLFLTPADPFAPFDPSDPFREYRGGVDAVRVRAFPGPFTELEAVVRPTETPSGTTLTGLARAQTSWGGWAVGGWGGVLHDAAAGAVFASGSVGSTAVRAEAALRDPGDGATVLRAALGIDRYFTPRGKDLIWIAEVQYDGFGTESMSNLLELNLSKPFSRGELQTLGDWSAATRISYQFHPLVGVDALVLTNLRDGSALFAPGLSWSATAAGSVRLGLFTGLGAPGATPVTLASEYGAVPTIGYLAVSWFF